MIAPLATITPPPHIEATVTPVCLGVCCDVHSTCLRYHAVEYAPTHTVRIGFCPNQSLFIPIFTEPCHA